MGQHELSAARTKVIFLADDDPDDVVIFEMALRDLGVPYNLIVSGNGQRLMDAIQSSEVKPDLIFLDVNMPIKNGIETLAEIRQCFDPCIKVYVLSTSSDTKTVRSSKSLGASGYLCKSASVAELSTALERLLFNQVQIPFFSMDINCEV